MTDAGTPVSDGVQEMSDVRLHMFCNRMWETFNVCSTRAKVCIGYMNLHIILNIY